MANIKNMQMCNSLCNDTRIGVVKSFFGFRTTTTYKPTNSIIGFKLLEMSQTDGARLKAILEAPKAMFAKTIVTFKPEKVTIGNYLLEMGMSADGEFAAAQLFQFVQLNYEPVTPFVTFEGEDAKAFGKLF